jgi:hypothetical protein
MKNTHCLQIQKRTKIIRIGDDTHTKQLCKRGEKTVCDLTFKICILKRNVQGVPMMIFVMHCISITRHRRERERERDGSGTNCVTMIDQMRAVRLSVP